MSTAAWIASFVPAKALQVEEEGWSAYPYGRSRHRCPFFDESRFSIQVDTLIVADDATSANAHNLSPEELAVREVGSFLLFLFNRKSSHNLKHN